jgi:RNA polymerase sigma-70 factor (ECF subfamily)
MEEEMRIVSLLQQGDSHAYKYIYDHYYVLLCKIAYAFLKDDFLAETVVGDTILHLYEKRENLQITSSLRNYLIQSVRNRSINYLELEWNKRMVNFSSLDGESLQAQILRQMPSDDYPLATLLEKELEQEIHSAIERLPVETRTVFKMSRFQEMKREDIAQKLNISVNTVKYHIKQAFVLLKKDLGKYLLFFTTLLHTLNCHI